MGHNFLANCVPRVNKQLIYLNSREIRAKPFPGMNFNCVPRYCLQWNVSAATKPAVDSS